MRLRGWLLTGVVAAAIAHVCFTAVQAEPEAADAATACFLVLAVWVALVGPSGPATWLRRAGVLLFAGSAVSASWAARDRDTGYRWIATGHPPSTVEYLTQALSWQQAVQLLGTACLAVAAVLVLRRGRPRTVVLTLVTAVAVAMPVLLTADLLRVLADGPVSVPEIVGVVLLPGLTAVAALTGAVAAWRTPAVAAGLLMLAVPFLVRAHNAVAGRIPMAFDRAPVVPSGLGGSLPVLVWTAVLGAALLGGVALTVASLDVPAVRDRAS